jgi:phage replication O-like protein O
MPFQSPNHTQIPNDLFDTMLRDMGYAELKVTLIALRKTLGWQKRSDKISLSQMTELTGLSRNSVLEGAQKAEERGTLTRSMSPRRSTTWVVNLVNQTEDHLVKVVNQSGELPSPDLVKVVNLQKKEIKEKKKITAKSAETKLSLYPLALALANVCHMDLKANHGRLFREAKMLSSATPPPTAALIEKNYNGDPAAFWKSVDWRGKKNQTPTPAAIRETWGQWESSSAATPPAPPRKLVLREDTQK